ncbi:MAG: pyridoxamine 5'-phosphate oxidase family protein [Thermodesulfobacteriota bacterium]
MRRKEFEVKERQLIEEVLNKAPAGYLAFNGADGWPRITPLNFVYEDGWVYWHGAVAGERFNCLREDPRAVFAAVLLPLYIPSYFAAEENATAATSTFKSVIVRGRVSSFIDPDEKCQVLNKLMAKYQPEGRYRKIAPNDPFYAKILPATGVYGLRVEEMAGKFKFAQNKSVEDRKKIIAKLKERGTAVDLVVAEEVEKTLGEIKS